MDEKKLLSQIKSEGTRATVMDVLHNTHDMDPKVVVVIGELIAMLESQRVIRRGSIVDFLSRTDKQFKL
jgi:hypothetical protein